MSNCASCPLHGTASNGIPAELVCPGGEKPEACSSSLLAYIGALMSSLQKKDFELNEVKWQWNERFPGCFISHYDWPRDLTWFIDRFKTASGDTRFEICYTMTDSKSIGAGDIFDNRVCVGYAFTVEEAKQWIYAHHEEYPKTAETANDRNDVQSKIRTMGQACRALLPDEPKPINLTFELFGNQYWILPKDHNLEDWNRDTDYVVESGNNWFELEIECSPTSGTVSVTHRHITKSKRALKECPGNPDVLSTKIEAAFIAAITGGDIGLNEDEMPKPLKFLLN